MGVRKDTLRPCSHEHQLGQLFQGDLEIAPKTQTTHTFDPVILLGDTILPADSHSPAQTLQHCLWSSDHRPRTRLWTESG